MVQPKMKFLQIIGNVVLCIRQITHIVCSAFFGAEGVGEDNPVLSLTGLIKMVCGYAVKAHAFISKFPMGPMLSVRL